MMDIKLAQKFERLGARVKFDLLNEGELRLDVRRDEEGEFFDPRFNLKAVSELQALDVQPKDRHLLLMARLPDQPKELQKQKFLCGHDERAWFVAAVPNTGGVSTIRTAMEALKPRAVRAMQTRLEVPFRERNRRRNEAFIRQGEWFFTPTPGFRPGRAVVLHNEPIRRGNGKPHICEFLCRMGGEVVYVSPQYPNGLTEVQYQRLIQRNFTLAKLQWRMMRRNPDTYVKGRIRHPDHKAVVLNDWHWVAMNTESQAPAMRNVVFLD
jgi:hypothetical protein